jgi:hypothetical protein
MQNSKLYIKRILLAIPVAAIVGISFMPLPDWGQKLLVLFALLWFNVILRFEVAWK